MTEYVQVLSELKQLPDGLHIFCPREQDDDVTKVDEGADLSTEDSKKIQDANDRTKKFFSALPLLAYDGQECIPYHEWIYSKLDEELVKCEVCIQRYYMHKGEFKISLLQEYDSDEVQQFLDIISRRDVERIKRGLTQANDRLQALPEQDRSSRNLAKEQLFAIFEALHSEPFFQDDHLLRQYFDKPFKLVQTKKDLKTTEIAPAVTDFLFSSQQERLNWAVKTWSRLQRSPKDQEWDFAIKGTLLRRLNRIENDSGLNKFWSAMLIVVQALSPDQIRHKLFDLGPNFAKLALDHLGKQTLAIPHIVRSMKVIFEKAPDAFWQAMISVSATTVAEQIFASFHFDRCLQNYASSEDASTALNVLDWIRPFLDCLTPANRPAATNTLAYQLFKRFRSEQVSNEVKQVCFEWAVYALNRTITGFTDDDIFRNPTGRLVVSDALGSVGRYASHILKYRPSGDKETRDRIHEKVYELVRGSISLDCQCLKSDFEALVNSKPNVQNSSYSPDIWQAIIDNLDPEDTNLSSAIFKGTMALPGLEQFQIRSDTVNTKEKSSYNDIFAKLTGKVSEVLERLAEFPSNHLDDLFANQNTCMALVATLFSPDQATYQAAVSILKNISGVSGRKEALASLLDGFYSNTIYSVCWVCRRIANMATFASVPRLLRTSMEMLDVLCDPTGLLRSKKLGKREVEATQSYWTYQWLFLTVVFRRMERWSVEIHDKPLMTDVCRDTMQYAQQLFKEYHLFLSILLKGKSSDDTSTIPKILLNTDEESSGGSPPKALEVMVKWLRLKDPYLAETLSGLIIDMLRRLKEYGATIPQDSNALNFVQDVATTTDFQKGIKTILSANQKAELIRALEQYTGKQIALQVKRPKQQRRLDQWTTTGRSESDAPTPDSVSISIDDEYDDVEIDEDDLRKLDEQELAKQQSTLPSRDKQKPPVATAAKPVRKVLSYAERQAEQAAKSKAFIEKRKQEQAAQKARAREIARQSRNRLTGDQTATAGSGVLGLGVEGKDHSAGQSSLMVSSESESDSDDDDELFGSKIASKPSVDQYRSSKQTLQGPVRKVKQVRSAKDMRARLAPDLTNLHKTILGWDFFADTDVPPNSDKDDYTLVTNTFKTPAEYQKTFEPLLVLEGWQSFRSAREDGNFKTFELKISSSLIVDNFFEINSQIPMAEHKELGLGPSDVVLLSKSTKPYSDADQPHCLARIKEVNRKKGDVQIVYRVNAANNPLRPYLNDKATIYGSQILSLTPLEREYGALMALPYYDLCEEIIRAKPSPLLPYTDTELRDFRSIYKVNLAQAKAVKSAVDNDAFTLIQGPPGSGKTKTICAIVGAVMTGFVTKASTTNGRALNGSRLPPPPAAKKILVCAPSNAAVDELVMRFKAGISLMDGKKESINVVRIGRSDAINAAVKDVTLEELVNARLSEALPQSNNGREDIHSMMMEHKAASDELFELKNKMTAVRSKGEQVSPQDDQLHEALKRKKLALGARIDDAREKQNSASRDADINRKRVQQEILDSAHVLCATLSGSGHEIFQSLNVEFETVVIDEAAQSIELSALIPLKYGCSKCILVGDPKQLPPTVLSRQAAKYQYEQSLFARMEGNHKKDVHLLDTQYRMHPEISAFPSRTFYDSRLQDGPNMAHLRARPWHHSPIFSPYRFFDVEGMSESSTKGRSLVNKAEIDVALHLYDRLVTDVPKYDFHGKIGIITPYKGQLKELRRKFSHRYGESITSNVEFNTTDAFQGRESEIIIFSCVRASTKGIGFLNDVRRMNVGLTRAKCSLWVLGNSQALVQGEFWRALVTDVKSRNLYTNGDIPQLLRRPLLTEDMMKDDVQMKDVDDENLPSIPETGTQKIKLEEVDVKSEDLTSESRNGSSRSVSGRSTPLSRPQSLSRPGSSISVSRTTSRDRNQTANGNNVVVSEQKSRTHDDAGLGSSKIEDGSRARSTGVVGPSGGKFGLNPKMNCSTCGSDEHFSHNCGNTQAKAEQIGHCSRCLKPGHTKSNCEAARCMNCGEIGHNELKCKATTQQQLTKQEKESVRRQEVEFGKSQEHAKQRRIEKQIGEHGAKIPVVRSTASGVSTAEGKRKRDDNQEKGPNKSVKPTSATGSAAGAERPTNGQAGMVRRKKAKDGDMFAKRR